MSEILHRHNTLHTLEYLALGTLSRILNTTNPSCSTADFQLNESDSVVSSDARLHINPLHFLAHSAVCSQMSCTSCLCNNNIQTPDQVSIPCTTPYFHRDTLTPPSSSKSPPLEGGGHSTHAACDASLYNACRLLRDLHPAP